jgi:hypothetical protein
MRLYHGTAARHVPAILERGLIPRGKRRGNWQHTVTSNPATVYLTNAYGFHFANQATKSGEDLAIVEVDTDRLFNLAPDEDFLEQVTRKNGPAPLDQPMKERTLWYRTRLYLYEHLWPDSLEHLGTCGHIGPIEPTAITRVATVPHASYMEMIFAEGLDPMISVLNYRIMGPHYRNSMRWIFGDEEREKNPFDHSRLAAATFSGVPYRKPFSTTYPGVVVTPVNPER